VHWIGRQPEDQRGEYGPSQDSAADHRDVAPAAGLQYFPCFPHPNQALRSRHALSSVVVELTTVPYTNSIPTGRILRRHLLLSELKCAQLQQSRIMVFVFL
jgi:hypothetical protein